MKKPQWLSWKNFSRIAAPISVISIYLGFFKDTNNFFLAHVWPHVKLLSGNDWIHFILIFWLLVLTIVITQVSRTKKSLLFSNLISENDRAVFHFIAQEADKTKTETDVYNFCVQNFQHDRPKFHQQKERMKYFGYIRIFQNIRNEPCWELTQRGVACL